jgi:hypothetical protein
VVKISPKYLNEPRQFSELFFSRTFCRVVNSLREHNLFPFEDLSDENGTTRRSAIPRTQKFLTWKFKDKSENVDNDN